MKKLGAYLAIAVALFSTSSPLISSAGGSGTDVMVRLSSPAARVGVLTVTEYDFHEGLSDGDPFNPTCTTQGLLTQGLDAYIVDLQSDGIAASSLSVSLVSSLGPVLSANVRYFTASCGLIRSDLGFSLSPPYSAPTEGAKWAAVSFNTGANITFNWSATNP